MQNKAARLLCNAAPCTKHTDLYTKVGWLTFNQLAAYHSILQVFKIKQAREPLYLAEIVCKVSRSGRITIPPRNLTLAADSYAFLDQTCGISYIETSKMSRKSELSKRMSRNGSQKMCLNFQIKPVNHTNKAIKNLFYKDL